MVNFEVASCSIFQENRYNYFLALKLAVAPVSLTLFVADDVISGYNVETFRDYHAANL